jgi:DmsE family decaheme c-type cytochrome
MRRVRWITGGLIASSILTLVLARVPASPAAAEAKYVGSAACQQCHEAQYKDWEATSHGRADKDAALLGGEAGCESCHGPGSEHVAADGEKTHPGFGTLRKLEAMKADDANTVCTSCHATGEQFYWGHSAHARKGVACIQCHDVHGSKSPEGMLRAESESKTCFACHRAKKFQTSKSAHMPVREGGMECSSCHNPHGTASPSMIKAASNNELCESCHAEKRGPVLWEHAPVRENCVTCHDAHGANNQKVLQAKQPFVCQRCHIATRHPSTLYDAPDLASNRLFNRSCTNCHSQVHGSNHPSGKFFLR